MRQWNPRAKIRLPNLIDKPWESRVADHFVAGDGRPLGTFLAFLGHKKRADRHKKVARTPKKSEAPKKSPPAPKKVCGQPKKVAVPNEFQALQNKGRRTAKKGRLFSWRNYLKSL